MQPVSLFRMHRVVLLAFSLLLSTTLLATPHSVANAAEKPNVLFIAVDDLNDWIGCLGGHPQGKTPHIDKLAARGAFFTQAHCAAPACNPSRAALLTGIRPTTSGVYLNPQPWRPAMPEAVTLPQFFRDNGYKAIGGGKIFHGGYNDLASWDFYLKSGGSPSPANLPANGIRPKSHFDWGPVKATDAEMNDYRVANWAIKQLNKKHDKPLFLACGIFRPHLPWFVPQKYFDMFPLESIQLPKVLTTDLDDVPAAGKKMARPDGDHRKVVQTDNWRNAVQAYLACIAFADAQVGRVIEALEKSEHASNTIVILWGDHGWHLGEKQHWRKFSLWEEATRAPLMIYAPGVTKAGSTISTPVSFVDIFPTLADLCGLKPIEQLEGQSLKPLLLNSTAPWKRPALTTHGYKNHALRSERFRYIRYENGEEELYDHKVDPAEWKNLAGDPAYADTKVSLRKWLPEVNAKNAAFDNRSKKGKAKKPKAKLNQAKGD